MLTNFKRILMAEADAATGAVVAPVVATAAAADVPQAQGAAITMTKEAFDAAIASAAEQAVAKAKDSIFADARRTFTAPKPSKTKTDDAPPALSSSEERTLLRGLDRTIAQLGVTPSAAQYARAERDLLAEKPEDVDVWTKDYFIVPKGSPPAAPAAVTTAPAPKPANLQPASDRGSPASTVPLIEQDIVMMSESDRAALIKEKGAKWFTEQYKKQAKGRSIRIV